MDGSASSRTKDRNLNLFHSLSRKYKTFLSPGVGDYQVEKLDVLKKSPVCRIGCSQRFDKGSSMQKYKVNLPISYQSNLGRDGSAPKKKLGVIGTERRFNFEVPEAPLPGPGEYNTHVFKSLSKGQISLMAMNDKNTLSPRTPQSRNMSQAVIIPVSSAMNSFNKASREQAQNLYSKECERELRSKNGPGPGCYNVDKAHASQHEKDRYSMP